MNFIYIFHRAHHMIAITREGGGWGKCFFQCINLNYNIYSECFIFFSPFSYNGLIGHNWAAKQQISWVIAPSWIFITFLCVSSSPGYGNFDLSSEKVSSIWFFKILWYLQIILMSYVESIKMQSAVCENTIQKLTSAI